MYYSHKSYIKFAKDFNVYHMYKKSNIKLLLSQAVCAKYAKHFSFSVLKNISLSLSV